MTTKILYSIGTILRTIFSFFRRFFRKLFSNEDKVRKIAIVLVFLIFGIKQLSNPNTKKMINNGLQVSLLDLEKQADAYAKDLDFDKSLAVYQNCVKIIVSKQNVSTIDIPSDAQQRICKNAAYTFLEYSFGKKLTESDKKLKSLFIEGLELQQKLGAEDEEIETLINRLNKR